MLGPLPKTEVFTRFTTDGKKVDYQDVWKLISIKPILNPSSIKTDYQLERGYQVLIFGGPKTVEVQSDEILNKKEKK